MRKFFAIRKARQMRMDAEAQFDASIHHCCRISENNPDLVFKVHRVGVFGYPKIELLDYKPKEVCLSERGDYIVVRDGEAFELVKYRR